MRQFTLAVLLSTAATVTSATNSAAGTPEDLGPEFVVTATRIPTPRPEIPAGVSIVDRQTIETRDYTTVTEALAAIPGIRVSQSGGPGQQASVFVRGTNSNQVLVLRDGMPINDSSDASGAFNFGADTLGDVERIEVIRGPLAATYGSGAIGGVINFITRRGREPGAHFSGDLAGGHPQQVIGNANVSGVTGKLDYMLNFESQSREGFDVTPRRESIYTGVPDGYRDRIGTVNLGFSPVDGTRFFLFGRARTAKFGFNTLGFPTFDAANSTGKTDSLLGRVGVDTKLFGGALSSGLFVGRLNEDRRYSELLNPLDPNQATNDSRYHGYRTDVQWNNTLKLDRLFTVPHVSDSTLTFGYEHLADEAHVSVDSSSFGSPFQQAARAHQDTDAGYLGVKATVFERLSLTAQARQESVDRNTPFTWRVGGVLAVPEASSRIKAAYGTAFRAASLFDRYGVDNFGYVGNPALKPERSEGFEIGTETDFRAFGRDDFATGGVTYFNQQVRNLIVNVFSPVDTAVNIGAAHIDGVEAELTMRPLRWLSVTGSYTYTQARDAGTGSLLLRRPRNAFSLNATAHPVPRLTIAPELLYTGAFRDFLTDNGGNPSNVGTSHSGLIANLTVSYKVTDGITLFADGRNLFDSRFEPVNGYASPGASFLAGTRVRF